MARERASAPEVPFGPRRLAEWAILALVIGLLALVFARQMRVLQGQTELSTVKTMLGTLRTAFVLDHLRRQAAADAAPRSAPQHNPFELLPRYPVNYLGVMSRSQALSAPAAGWVFDPDCVCVGYRPMGSEWLHSPSGDVMVWYRVTGTSGPLQLTAKEAYVWQAELLN